MRHYTGSKNKNENIHKNKAQQINRYNDFNNEETKCYFQYDLEFESFQMDKNRYTSYKKNMSFIFNDI